MMMVCMTEKIVRNCDFYLLFLNDSEFISLQRYKRLKKGRKFQKQF